MVLLDCVQVLYSHIVYGRDEMLKNLHAYMVYGNFNLCSRLTESFKFIITIRISLVYIHFFCGNFC